MSQKKKCYVYYTPITDQYLVRWSTIVHIGSRTAIIRKTKFTTNNINWYVTRYSIRSIQKRLRNKTLIFLTRVDTIDQAKKYVELSLLLEG